MKIPRMVLAGTSSGVGKTSIIAAIIHGIKKRGYSVQPFKVGPDFIDPTYLSAVSGISARNLDAWLMGQRGVLKDFVQNSQQDISVIEGVMGYYDGFAGDTNFASTYHVSKIVKSPVILVLDASKAARSIAATALGFVKFQKNSRICGLILNKIGSKRHEDLCRQALSKLDIPIVGAIPRDLTQSLESRHLGLIPVNELKSLEQKIRSIAKSYSDYIDIEKIIEISNKTPRLPVMNTASSNKRPRTRIAVALDESFNFYYKENLDSLRREGASLEFFSPIHDKKIPLCDGVYIGGGFPEVKGESLEKNNSMKKQIKKKAEEGAPIYAECGGLMYLTRSIRYGKKRFDMIGLYDADTVMQKKLKLNYTKAATTGACAVSRSNASLHGHEFHFSELESISKDSRFAYKMEIGIGIDRKRDGMIQYNTLASYMHMHFAQPNIAKTFVENCIKISRS
ncbi:MAG: hydrogenobyrinic acid a,c-diamide synthase (glutamine-hydrolyzing) [Thaumarchaeota archaeon]|nr:hydrogenobyrinic acid a,c-diamide synthase (glutamine-hydrolyzing) [Nitrososphaerota archaeon]